MAELTVGGALLSGFIDVLLDRLASQEVLDFFQRRKPIPKLINDLKITLLSANVLLNDAEKKQLREPNVRKWLDELKEVLYEADRVMDKISTEALRLKLEKGESERQVCKPLNFVPSLFSLFGNAVKSEIEEINGRLKHLLSQTDFLGLKKKVDQKTPTHRSYAPLVEECEVFGREVDKEAIVKLLLTNDVGGHKISVIPIVGMGGIGKTTLAQLVYNDGRVQEHFDLKVWVTVSDEFDIFKITKLIFQQITSCNFEILELHQLQNELKEALMGKKFLFVHDDVWNENYELWDILKSSFESGAHGSKIIVTTRSAIVARRMGTVQAHDLQIISDDYCLQLFVKHVFENIGYDVQSELLEIGREIVKKCKGLPLAVKSMAGLLRSIVNPNEWRWVLESDIWELQNQENHNTNIIPALWLSYHFLPPHLKRCFAYFSLFPKDYEFCEREREQIILVWMAEGLLQPQQRKRLEDVGEEYLNGLILRSFFQQYRRGDESFLSMHDLMHDLAMHISGEFCFVYNSHNDLHNFSSKTHYFSYRKDFNEKIECEDLSKSKCLHNLLALPLKCSYQSYQPVLTEKVLRKLLPRAGGCLRVLSLSEFSITELPKSIGKLHCLRYLDVSGTHINEIPNSVCTLYNLQTLMLKHCRKLTQLPANISKLINLRHLMIRGTPLKEMPRQLCKMTNLQTLSDFFLAENDGSRIKELGNLQNLHGSLCIFGLENVKDVGDVLEANLKNKKHLTELILRWKAETDDSTKQMEVLNALQPHVNLRELRIIGYGGTILPTWVSHPSYCNLERVDLIRLVNCCLFPSFKQLGSLRELYIDGLDGVLGIYDEFCGGSLTKSFQFLVKLKLSGLNMSEWSLINQGDMAGDIFPCLKSIDLQSCKELNVGIPACKLPSLAYISISKCDEMVAVFPTSPHIDAAYPCLENLDIHYCLRLESFSGMGLPSSIKQLKIIGCNLLLANRMNWNLQRVSSLVSLSFDGNEDALHSFPEEELLPMNLKHLVISHFKNIKALNGKGFQHLTCFQGLYLLYCNQLECLPAEGLPRTLTSLQIVGCALLSPRCQREIGEDWPKIADIPRIYII